MCVFVCVFICAYIYIYIYIYIYPFIYLFIRDKQTYRNRDRESGSIFNKSKKTNGGIYQCYFISYFSHTFNLWLMSGKKVF